MATTPQVNTGNDLVRLHKAFSRALIIMMQHSQAAGPELELRDGFRSYVLAFHNTLDTHHRGEDEIAFPFWSPKLPRGCCDRLTAQHQKLLPLLARLQDWLDSGNSAWEEPSLARLHSTLAAVNSLWHSHIPLEEETIGPYNASHLLTPEENAQLTALLAAYAQEHTLPHELTVPFLLYNVPVEERSELARLFPDVVVQHLVPIAWRPVWAPMQPFLLE